MRAVFRFMRLYLSSFRLGDHSDQLLGLIGPNSQVAVVGNALDAAPDAIRRAGVDRELRDLTALGLQPQELDLRQSDAVDLLSEVGAVWVRGGNVFVLRQAMADAGADHWLVELIRQDRLVYSGYSAGPAVLAPSLEGLQLVDEVAAVREPIWQGLGVLDRFVVPHVNSPGHPETADCDRLSAQLSREQVAHWALRDGEVLLVNGRRAAVLPRAERR